MLKALYSNACIAHHLFSNSDPIYHGSEDEPRPAAGAAHFGERIDGVDMGSPRTYLDCEQLGRCINDTRLAMGAGLLVAMVLE